MVQRRFEKNFIIIAWPLLFALMLGIYFLSSQPTGQSLRLSMGIAEKIYEVQSVFVGENSQELCSLDEINWLMRRFAHFLLFLILGILTAFSIASVTSNSRKWILPAILICILYAVGDEFHQMFVLGRTASVQDVLLDSAGSITGIAWYHWRRGRRDDGKI